MRPSIVPLVPAIVLLGPPGAGKSKVGPLLAAALGFSFVDLDEVVGVSHLVVEGLCSFRVREHLALTDVARGPVVVAAGAGIVDTAPARAFLRRCLCVGVDVDVDTALLRLGAALVPRPWLSGSKAEQRASWLQREQQRPAFRLALGAGTVDGRAAPAEVARQLQALVEGVGIGCDELDEVNHELLLSVDDPSFIIADSAVAARLQRCDMVIDTTAEGKRLAVVERMLAALSAAGLTRTAVIVGVGGGALLDMVGLAAALFHRGTRWRAVPTTLLAMVDAGLGGKTAVDVVVSGVAGGVVVRNAAGAFHEPASSCLWPGFLHTLPAAALRHGRAEMLKHRLLGAEESLWSNEDDLSPAALCRSRGTKRFVVDRDAHEQHFRQALNLGHTFAHAFEARFGIAHGDAVLHGLSCMLQASVDVAGLEPLFAQQARALVDALGAPALPTLSDEDRRALVASMGRDKKGRGRLVLLRGPGRPVVATVDDAVMSAALRTLGVATP